jgi:hypothetical protein
VGWGGGGRGSEGKRGGARGAERPRLPAQQPPRPAPPPCPTPPPSAPHLQRGLCDGRRQRVAAKGAAVLAAPDGQHHLVVRQHLQLRSEFDRGTFDRGAFDRGPFERALRGARAPAAAAKRVATVAHPPPPRRAPTALTGYMPPDRALPRMVMSPWGGEVRCRGRGGVKRGHMGEGGGPARSAPPPACPHRRPGSARARSPSRCARCSDCPHAPARRPTPARASCRCGRAPSAPRPRSAARRVTAAARGPLPGTPAAARRRPPRPGGG